MTKVTVGKASVVGLYCRVSSEEQVRSGRSLENQEALLREYCTRRWPGRGQEVYAEVASARRTNRRRYQAMLRDVRTGHVGVVAAVELSRLWRNAQDAGRDVGMMESKGCELMVWNEGIDTSTAFGRAAFTIMAAMAQLESDSISDRVKRAHAIARQQGRKGPGRRPFGWLVGPDGKMFRSPEEQRTIDLVSGLRARGETWGRTAALLNTTGVKPVGGAAWSEGGVRLVMEAAISRRLAEAEGPIVPTPRLGG